MKTVFGDAGYWIAVLNPDDELHTKATALSARLGSLRIITSEMVLVEVLNGLGKKDWICGVWRPVRWSSYDEIQMS
jgi:predicted nucleic acid-binding protein